MENKFRYEPMMDNKFGYGSILLKLGEMDLSNYRRVIWEAVRSNSLSRLDGQIALQRIERDETQFPNIRGRLIARVVHGQ